jgi:hypothetical protein
MQLLRRLGLDHVGWLNAGVLECIGVAQELGLGVVKAQELFGMDVAHDCPGGI